MSGPGPGHGYMAFDAGLENPQVVYVSESKAVAEEMAGPDARSCYVSPESMAAIRENSLDSVMERLGYEVVYRGEGSTI